MRAPLANLVGFLERKDVKVSLIKLPLTIFPDPSIPAFSNSVIEFSFPALVFTFWRRLSPTSSSDERMKYETFRMKVLVELPVDPSFWYRNVLAVSGDDDLRRTRVTVVGAFREDVARSMYRTFVACGRRMMSFEGEVRLRGGYVEGIWTRWVEVGGRKLVDMLKEMGWWTSSRPARVRVTIEVLDPGRDFEDEG